MESDVFSAPNESLQGKQPNKEFIEPLNERLNKVRYRTVLGIGNGIKKF